MLLKQARRPIGPAGLVCQSACGPGLFCGSPRRPAAQLLAVVAAYAAEAASASASSWSPPASLSEPLQREEPTRPADDGSDERGTWLTAIHPDLERDDLAPAMALAAHDRL